MGFGEPQLVLLVVKLNRLPAKTICKNGLLDNGSNHSSGERIVV